MVNNIANYSWSSYSEYLRGKSGIGLVDKDLVLGMLLDYGYESIRGFVDFSNEHDDNLYLENEIDQVCDVGKPIMDINQAMSYTKEFLSTQGLLINDIYNHNCQTKDTITHRLALELKEKSVLILREIGELIGVSKSTVGRLVKQ